MDVTVLAAQEQIGLRVRVRRSDGTEPDLVWSGKPESGRYRLLLSWPKPAVLERPLPSPGSPGVGPLAGVVLRLDGGRTTLELQLTEPVQPWLRKLGSDWVLQLDPAPQFDPSPAERPVQPPAPSQAAVPPAAAASPIAAALPGASANPPSPGIQAIAAPATKDGRSRPRPSGPEPLLVDLVVNGSRQPAIARAERRSDGTVVLAADSWTQARLRPAPRQEVMSDGTPAYALEAVPGLRHHIDRSALTLVMEAPASAFDLSTIGAAPAWTQAPPRPDPAALLNYDASLSGGEHEGRISGGATLEGVLLGHLGTLSTSALVRQDGDARSVTRLQSYWRFDMPDRMETVVLGDTVGVGGGWSRPVRFGGVRWGRDFSMRPGFVTMPQPSLRGEAALPSTVDVLVNNARRISQKLEPGPFDLAHVPVMVGAGEVNLVVRDLLGRETVLTQSYYASPRLLAPGLSDHSLEAGWLRTGFGVDSRYGQAFGAGTWRYGLTSDLTGEVRLELQRDRSAAGLEVSGLLGTWAVGRLAWARAGSVLRGVSESGYTMQAGIERTSASAGFSLQYEQASHGYAPLGESSLADAAAQRLRRRWAANAGTNAWGRFNAGLSLVRQELWNGEALSSLGGSLSFPIGPASITVAVNRRMDESHAWSGGIYVNVPLGDEIRSDSRAERQKDGKLSAAAAAARNVPAAGGVGWRVEASTQNTMRARGSLYRNGPHGETSADVSSDAQGRVAARVGARGTVGAMSGLVFASRPVGEGAFAVVEVPGIKGVPVKLGHRPVAQTDDRGRAFVPGLLPWHRNRLEIDLADLPLDSQLSEDVREVVPYARSGNIVRFDVRRNRAALLVLQRPDGQPVPIGAKVRLLPAGPEFIVARRGEAWVEHLEPGQRIRVTWKEGVCELLLDVPDAVELVGPTSLGPLVCGQEGKP